jgi:hypothetical protein
LFIFSSLKLNDVFSAILQVLKGFNTFCRSHLASGPWLPAAGFYQTWNDQDISPFTIIGAVSVILIFQSEPQVTGSELPAAGYQK